MLVVLAFGGAVPAICALPGAWGLFASCRAACAFVRRHPGERLLADWPCLGIGEIIDIKTYNSGKSQPETSTFFQ